MIYSVRQKTDVKNVQDAHFQALMNNRKIIIRGCMKKNNFIKNILLTAMFSTALAGCDFASAPKDEIHADGKTMGTFFSITVVGDYPGGQKGLDKDADEVLRKINKEISTFDKDSLLSKFNNSKSTAQFRITQDMADILIESLRVGNDLDGATDITVGPLVNLWGFGPKKVEQQDRIPTDEEISAARANIGLDKLHVEISKNAAYVRKDNPDIYVDLSTVGEGYGADKLAELLELDLDHKWSEDTLKDLKAAYFLFAKLYRTIYKGMDRKAISDAFLLYLSLFPVKSLQEDTDDQIIKNIK